MKESDTHKPQYQEKDLLLSLAALFEGEFSLDWLEEMTGLKASLVLSILEEEVQSGLLARQKPAIYRFQGDQERQALLMSLSPGEKERFRRNIAAILIRELNDDDSKALAVAQHLLAIPNDWMGCQWVMRAGELYVRSFDAERAIACFTHVLRELSHQTGDNEDWLFIKAAIEYSNIYAGRRDTSSSLSYLKEARERAKRLDKPSYEILLEMHIAKYERLRSEFNSALSRFQAAFSRVESMNDPDLNSATTMFSTYFLFWQGRFRDVIAVYEKSVPDVERYPIGHFPLIAAMMVGHCYTMTGQVTQGLGMLDAIRSYCLQKSDRYLSAQSGSSIAMAMFSINHTEDTLRYLRLSLKEANEGNNYWVKTVATLMLALVSYLEGNKKESSQYLRKFLRNRTEGQVSMLPYPYLIELAWLIEHGDLPPQTGVSLEREIEWMLREKNIFMKGIAYRYQAKLGKSRGWSDREITRLFALSAKHLEESGNQIELAKTHLELTRHYLSTGNEKKGKETMRVAAQILSAANAELIPDDLRAVMGDRNPEGTILTEILNLADEMKGDDKKLLQQIVATANRITGAERGALLLIDETTDPPALQLRASKNLTLEQLLDPGFAPSRKMTEEVIASGKGRIFEMNPVADTTAPVGEMIRSSICVPLIHHKRTIGVLYHENRLLSNVFKTSDLRLLAYCAALATLALDGEQARQEVVQLQRAGKTEKQLPSQKDGSEPYLFEGIIGVSPAMQHVLAQIEQVARMDTAVLILGETGVGKNLAAAALHRQSLRNKGPFITVQCSALTESLITSELFGHEKGAFTGATNKRIGRFELANGGTLFLDEIGDLSLEVQARLLRVLQSKEFERVGGGKDILTSDFRLIAATNRDLEEEVRAKRFREDLYYRINVFPLHVPPLRDRKEDIPLLARHFLRAFAAKQGMRFDEIPEDVLNSMVRHDWPGNIRELENVVQRGVISSRSPRFQLPSLEPARLKVLNGSDVETLKENERRHILNALQKTGWKIHGPDGAAELLDINASTLASRMKKLGIVKSQKNYGR